jgi:hypothetical protein
MTGVEGTDRATQHATESDPMATQDEFDRIWREQATTRRRRIWPKHDCPICGATISEGMGSGQAGNFKKHVEACERKRAAAGPAD